MASDGRLSFALQTARFSALLFRKPQGRRSMFIEALAVLALSGSASAPVQERGAPRGDYTRSCSGSYVNRGRLYADCQDMRGRTRATSIELGRCSSDEVQNVNGLLVCGSHRGEYEQDDAGGNGGGWTPGRPGGPGPGNGPGGGGWNPGGPGGRSEITVYDDANFRGASQTWRSEMSDLARSGLNDRISSFELRGSWEVCSDANFRGRCQTFNQGVRNLRDTGWGDRISSVRPAGRGRP